jgi:hypothetical protein
VEIRYVNERAIKRWPEETHGWSSRTGMLRSTLRSQHVGICLACFGVFSSGGAQETFLGRQGSVLARERCCSCAMEYSIYLV